MNGITRILSANIKKIRKENNMSQTDLANVTGLSKGFLGDIEMARKFPSAVTLEKLSKALHVKVADLFLEESDQKKQSVSNIVLNLKTRVKKRMAEVLDEICDLENN